MCVCVRVCIVAVERYLTLCCVYAVSSVFVGGGIHMGPGINMVDSNDVGVGLIGADALADLGSVQESDVARRTRGRPGGRYGRYRSRSPRGRCCGANAEAVDPFFSVGDCSRCGQLMPGHLAICSGCLHDSLDPDILKSRDVVSVEKPLKLVLRWTDRIFDQIPFEDLNFMAWWFNHNLYLFTEFTGIGTCEYWLQGLALALSQLLGRPVQLPTIVEGCDVNRKIQKVMGSGKGKYKMQQMCPAVEAHLKPSALKKFHEVNWCEPTFMELMNPDQQQALLADQIHEVKAICHPSAFIHTKYKCGFSKAKVCTQNVPHGVHDGEAGHGKFFGIRANGSGITCLDFTQYGLGKGMMGPHGKVIVCWCCERGAYREPWIVECAYSQELLAFVQVQLEDLYTIEYARLDPYEWGECMHRVRGWMRGVLSSNFQIASNGALSRLPGLLAHEQFIKPEKFFFMDGTDYMAKVVGQRAADRHVVPRPNEDLTYESTLTVREKVSRSAYMETLQQLKESGKWSGEGFVTMDLAHDGSSANCGKLNIDKLSTFTRHTLRYSPSHHRCMLGLEQATAMGFAFGETVHVLAEQNLIDNAGSGLHLYPYDELLNQKDNFIIRAIGNGQSVINGAMVWAWTLAHLYPLKLGAGDFPATHEACLKPEEAFVPNRAGNSFGVMQAGHTVPEEEGDNDDGASLDSDCENPVMPWTWQ